VSHPRNSCVGGSADAGEHTFVGAPCLGKQLAPAAEQKQLCLQGLGRLPGKILGMGRLDAPETCGGAWGKGIPTYQHELSPPVL